MDDVEKYLPCVKCITMAICKAEYAACVEVCNKSSSGVQAMDSFVTNKYIWCETMHVQFSYSTPQCVSYMNLFRRFFDE